MWDIEINKFKTVDIMWDNCEFPVYMVKEEGSIKVKCDSFDFQMGGRVSTYRSGKPST